MRRIAVVLSCLITLACQATPEPTPVDAASDADGRVDPNPPAESSDRARPPTPKTKTIVRKELVAEDLPPLPDVGLIATTELGAGSFEFPDGADELVPRAALAVRDGVLLVGQGYLDRRPGAPAQTRRWSGFIPSNPSGAGEPRSSLDDPGAIRAAIPRADGGLVVGSTDVGTAARGWFATVNPDGTIVDEVALESPALTELFTLVSGQVEPELAVVGGYVDSQGWLVSLDASGARRFEKYIGSVGYTQVRALARLDDGDLLAVGTRMDGFGQAWFARAPGDGGQSPAPDDVVQDKIEIVRADPNQTLRLIVDVGERGYVALGTAKRNFIQAHDQLLAVGFDRTGAVTSARVIEGVRVTDVLGVERAGAGVRFLVAIPIDEEPQPATALAFVDLPADPLAAGVVRKLGGTDGWTATGYVGGAQSQLLTHRPMVTGVQWRLLTAGQ